MKICARSETNHKKKKWYWKVETAIGLVFKSGIDNITTSFYCSNALIPNLPC